MDLKRGRSRSCSAKLVVVTEREAAAHAMPSVVEATGVGQSLGVSLSFVRSLIPVRTSVESPVIKLFR